MKEELEKHHEELAYKRRINSQALAVLGRAKRAGIPKKYMRIGPDEFQSILCDKFHPKPQEFTQMIFKSANDLFKRSFIIIDGGDKDSRKKAGYAILFRMLACDKLGTVANCSKLSSDLQSIRYGKGVVNRNDLVEELKREEALFISEISKTCFNPHFDAGIYFDQILEYRDDYERTTILTFSNALESIGGNNSGNAITEDNCGSYIAMLSHVDLQPIKNVLRVRVKREILS